MCAVCHHQVGPGNRAAGFALVALKAVGPEDDAFDARLREEAQPGVVLRQGREGHVRQPHFHRAADRRGRGRAHRLGGLRLLRAQADDDDALGLHPAVGVHDHGAAQFAGEALLLQRLLQSPAQRSVQRRYRSIQFAQRFVQTHRQRVAGMAGEWLDDDMEFHQ